MKEKIGGPVGLVSQRKAALKSLEPKALDLNATLRQVRVPVITIECRACGRSDGVDRKVLVRKHGAEITFARLRRMAAMGCERLISADGDQCETRFHCLERPGEEQPRN